MAKLTLLIILFIISEALIAFFFAVTAQIFYKKIGFDFKSIIKGVIERLFLFVSLVNNYAQSLTFFSALKLATRLKHNEAAQTENKFNDYYLVGNLISVAVAMGYVYIYQNFDEIKIFHQLTN